MGSIIGHSLVLMTELIDNLYWNKLNSIRERESPPMTNGRAWQCDDDLPGVLPHVGNEIAALGEGFPADDALVRLLTLKKCLVKDFLNHFSKISVGINKIQSELRDYQMVLC